MPNHQQILRVVLATTLVVTATTVVGTDQIDNTPWIEKNIQMHVDQHDYAGILTAEQLQRLSDHGRQLFAAKFTAADGVGRPMATQAIIPTKRKQTPRQAFSRTAGMDANACASCHNDPLMGGAGDFTANVFVSEGFNNTDFDNTDPQFSNERNTNHLMGAGLVELLAREMSHELIGQRSNALLDARAANTRVNIDLNSKGVSFGQLIVEPDGRVLTDGIDGVDPDLIIRPFSQKGVMTSLRQFTINALNHHLGMQASERFGERWTDESDFDEDGISAELTIGDISALVAWQATLAPPLITPATSDRHQSMITTGQSVFTNVGCADCHRPSLPLSSLTFADPGPLDNAGTLRAAEVDNGSTYNLALLTWAKQLPRDTDGNFLIPLFGDLKRHRISDQQVSILGNELLAQRFVDRDVFITSELWGVASTAPYGHRGDLPTFDEIIRAHGGEAKSARESYIALNDENTGALITFLKTLVITP